MILNLLMYHWTVYSLYSRVFQTAQRTTRMWPTSPMALFPPRRDPPTARPLRGTWEARSPHRTRRLRNKSPYHKMEKRYRKIPTRSIHKLCQTIRHKSPKYLTHYSAWTPLNNIFQILTRIIYLKLIITGTATEARRLRRFSLNRVRRSWTGCGRLRKGRTMNLTSTRTRWTPPRRSSSS